MRRLPILLAIAGLCLATLIVATHGFGRVVDAALSVGPFGFAATVAVQLALFAILAAAWHAACPDLPWRDLLLGRMVRESGTNVLPFSYVGGIAFGVQATSLRGVGFARGFAANVVDVTFESMAQIVFIALGLLALLARGQDSRLAWPLGLGLPLMAVAIGAFVWLQRGGRRPMRRVFSGFAQRLARNWGQVSTIEGIGQVGCELDAVYASPARLALACLLHLVAWIGGAAWTWLTFNLLGAPVGPVAALAIEGVVSGVLTLSFLVPGNLGVQEAAYVALASAFGIGADPALGLSLVRRAKDLAIGVPVLLLWQAIAVRRLRAPAHAAAASLSEH